MLPLTTAGGALSGGGWVLVGAEGPPAEVINTLAGSPRDGRSTRKAGSPAGAAAPSPCRGATLCCGNTLCGRDQGSILRAQKILDIAHYIVGIKDLASLRLVMYAGHKCLGHSLVA